MFFVIFFSLLTNRECLHLGSLSFPPFLYNTEKRKKSSVLRCCMLLLNHPFNLMCRWSALLQFFFHRKTQTSKHEEQMEEESRKYVEKDVICFFFCIYMYRRRQLNHFPFVHKALMIIPNGLNREQLVDSVYGQVWIIFTGISLFSGPNTLYICSVQPQNYRFAKFTNERKPCGKIHQNKFDTRALKYDTSIRDVPKELLFTFVRRCRQQSHHRRPRLCRPFVCNEMQVTTCIYSQLSSSFAPLSLQLIDVP